MRAPHGLMFTHTERLNADLAALRGRLVEDGNVAYLVMEFVSGRVYPSGVPMARWFCFRFAIPRLFWSRLRDSR